MGNYNDFDLNIKTFRRKKRMKICVLQVFIPAGTPALAEIPAIIPVEGYKPVVVDTADNISFIFRNISASL